MAGKKIPDLWIETGENRKVCVVISGAYKPDIHLPSVRPAEALIAAAETDYTPYCREIPRLYEDHPLFEERLDVPESQLRGLGRRGADAPLHAPGKRPAQFFELGSLPDQALRMQDSGSAAFHLRAAQLPPQVSEIPIRTQIRLRGIMGMTFGGMKRVPFEKLRGAYPDAAAFYRSCSVEWTRERDLTVPCGRRLSAAPGGIDEAFLHSVDATHVLGSYDTVEQVLSPEESIWQKRVAANLDFALCGTPLILYAS